MKVLFIGGTGKISSACSRLAVGQGIDLYHLNRGKSHRHIEGVKTIVADIHEPKQVAKALEGQTFDAVVDWIAFSPDDVRNDIALFRGKTSQFIFISSASAYKKPVDSLPITENTPLENKYWQYSRDKIACENILMEEYRKSGFPVTIVRPSHTYDETLIPADWGYTVLDRIRKGKKTLIHGDGTSLWVMTHHKDFAVGFNGLLGNKKAIGEAYQITGDELLPWNKIYGLLADAYGVALDPVHVASDVIARYDPAMVGSLLGDKANSVIFDNSKIKALVPSFKQTILFEQGAKEIVSFYTRNPDFGVVDPKLDALIEKIIAERGL